MRLYHYAKEPYKSLLTSRYTIKRTAKQIEAMEKFNQSVGRKYGYLDHISFFFEPIPEDLGTMYLSEDIEDHPVWFPGNKLWVHEVETLNLEFAFDVVETPFNRTYLDQHCDDRLAKQGNLAQKHEWLRQRDTELRLRGYSGEMGLSSAALTKAIRPFLGGTRTAYLNTLAVNPFEVLSSMYAPDVPHVMIYPKEKEIILISPPYPITLV